MPPVSNAQPSPAQPLRPVLSPRISILGVVAILTVGVVVGASATWALLFGALEAATPWVDALFRIILPAFGLLALVLLIVLPVALWSLRRFITAAQGTLEEVITEVGAAGQAYGEANTSLAIKHSERAVRSIIAWYTPMAARRWIVQTAFALMISFGGLVGTALIFRQTVLLTEQNKKLQAQTDLLSQQVVIATRQNEKLDQQTITAEAQRRTTLTSELFAILQTISALSEKNLKPELQARIVAFSRAATPYWTIEVDAPINFAPSDIFNWAAATPKLAPRPRSPERGQLLVGLTTAGVEIPDGTIFAGADLRNTDLTKQNLSDMDLSAAEFSHSVLKNVWFEGTDLQAAVFHDAIMQRAKFRTAKLNGARITGSRLERCSFVEAQMAGISLYASKFESCDMTGAYLSQANVQYGTFGNTKFDGAVLDLAILSNTQFEGTTSFRGAQLQGANLEGAVFPESTDWEGAVVGFGNSTPPDKFPVGWSGAPKGWKLVRANNLVTLSRDDQK